MQEILVKMNFASIIYNDFINAGWLLLLKF